MNFRIPIADRERPALAGFVILFAVTIVSWAVLHDIYLIGVEPRHFTVYHRPLLPLSNPILLAMQYAVVATVGPGMVFGGLSFSASRLGALRPLSLRFAWFLFLPFIAVIECSALMMGALARSRHAGGGSLPYPSAFYPDTTAGIAYSQSVNISAYVGAVSFGGLFLMTLLLVRRQKR
ncbi:hypothetical protein [Rariglobus hedericola]|uniref:Uncharacterized protein n=1 Tax=Rariglobus hedericola TaxID=2597822 RepID=A0A556QP03_9BACT|nr:hypothetical protein [Rariglobus hedericola]TSJ78347.1 hypothetical protein FPL22_03315 [Rariglobus hedericola]